jgi:hypothetical protein
MNTWIIVVWTTFMTINSTYSAYAREPGVPRVFQSRAECVQALGRSPYYPGDPAHKSMCIAEGS